MGDDEAQRRAKEAAEEARKKVDDEAARKLREMREAEANTLLCRHGLPIGRCPDCR